tara:strand:+ start:5167 stop:5403 length:237 start_codon:yes stop_codon:yes gene_type:complete
MTITNPKTIVNVLKAGGIMDGDQMAAIYAYKGPGGKQQFSVFTDHRWDDMLSSSYVSDVHLLMSDGKLTKAGEVFLQF